MRHLLRSLLCATLVALSTNLTFAAEVKLQSYPFDQLKKARQKVGGQFLEESGGYGYGTDCKGGSGTDCVVFCPTNANAAPRK